MQPLIQAMKSHIKDRNDFLSKPRSLPKIPGNIILYMVDILGFYPNIPEEEAALTQCLDNQMKNYNSSDTRSVI